MKSVVLIIPTDMRVDANAIACALGYDTPPGDTYSVPLSANGQEPATHYGTHTWASATFLQMLDGDIPYTGLTNGRVAEIRAALIYSVQDESLGHFDDVLDQHGLQRVIVERVPV